MLDGEIVAFDRPWRDQLQPPPAPRPRAGAGLSLRIRPAAPRGRGSARSARCASARPACAARFASRVGCASPRTATSTARRCSPRPAARASRASSPSVPTAPTAPSRSRDWLKLKCHAEQELVIGGFTAPQGSRTHFGALLVGHHEHGAAGSTRARWAPASTPATLSELGGRLRKLERDLEPVRRKVHPVPRGAHWVEPEMVAQIGFTEWTRDGRLPPPPLPRPPRRQAGPPTWCASGRHEPRRRSASQDEDGFSGDPHHQGRPGRLLRARGRVDAAAHRTAARSRFQVVPGRHRAPRASSRRTRPATTRAGSST